MHPAPFRSKIAPMILERIEDAGLSQYSFAVGFKDEVAIVDPRRDVDVDLNWAENHRARRGLTACNFVM